MFNHQFNITVLISPIESAINSVKFDQLLSIDNNWPNIFDLVGPAGRQA